MMDQALLCLFVEETVERSYPPDLGTLSGGQSGLVHKTNVGETDRESGTHKFTQNETFQPLFIPVLYFLHWATMIKDKLLTLRHFELKMLKQPPSSWFPANTHPHTLLLSLTQVAMIAEKICWFVYPLLLLRGILVVTHNHQAGHREDALMLINDDQQMVFMSP